MSLPFSTSEINEIRKLFPHTKNGSIYMNHAAISPLPRPVKEALDKCIEERYSGAIENFEKAMQIIDHTRQDIAEYINAESGQITFTGNTSDAISAVASGLEWNSGDEIILNSMEFPANVQPFRRLESQGVKLRYVPHRDHTITTDDIRTYITPKTKLVSVSAVQYLSGYKADLEAIGSLCRENNLLFVVDGIQALGASPIDVKLCHVDALGNGAHKWLMAPMGIGFLYLSEKMQSKLSPVKTRWLSVEDPWALTEFDQPWLPVSSHLETGTPNLIGIAGLGASIQLFKSIGVELIERQILNLTGFIISKLERIHEANIQLITPRNNHQRMGIVSFALGKNVNHEEVLTELKKKKITISSRENYFRISPHFYNTDQEIDNLLDQLSTIV
ncbi:aminotransferase class V-fold PLP-dependent enzyme [soil metagenome]